MKLAFVWVRSPSREATVASFSARIGMSASLYSPPVISSSQHQSINTIKDTFIVGSCPVRIDQGQLASQLHLIRKKFRFGRIPAEKAIVDDTAGCYEAIRCIV